MMFFQTMPRINMPTINFILILILLAICCRLTIGLQKDGKEEQKPPRAIPCGLSAAREYLHQLKQIAQQERWKADHLQGMVAQRSSWLAAKANYAVYQARNPQALLKPELRILLEETYLTVMRARVQNDLGAKEITEEKGSKLRAYRSPVDDTLQTYSVSVPDIYDPAIAWPLVVSLHGHGWYAPFQGHPAPRYGGVIVLSPQGRGASDYKDLGEDDVLAAIADVKRHYHVDPDRVYLTGSSMGGTGAFHLGVHYADQFAAIFPIVGNADNKAWTERWGWNRHFPGRNDQLRDFVQESHTARAFAQNLRNLPAYILAGAADTIVPPAHSRNLVSELKRLNIRHEYREYPNVGHGGFPKDATDAGMGWMCGWKRNRYPKQVTWKTDLLKHGKAYWTRIDQLEKPMQAGSLDASAQSPTRLTISTRNLQAFSVQKPKQLFDSGTLTVTVDGVNLKLQPPTDSDLSPETWHTFRKHPGTGLWMREQDVEVQAIAKKTGCEGPVHEAFMNPFIIVVGTTSETMSPVWKREALLFAENWKFKNNAYPRILLDTDVTEQLAQSYNLILFGGSSDNAYASKVIAATPIKELQSLVQFNTKKQIFDRPDVGSIMVYPNIPAAPDKLVVLIHANAPQAAYQLWGRFGNWFNWGVFDSKKYFDFAIFDSLSSSPETMLLVGWFGSDWSTKNAAYFFGNPQVRKDSAPQHYPSVTSLKDQTNPPQELMLYDVMPNTISQMRGAIGLGRTFFGEPLPQSIGMRAPATLEYELGEAYDFFTSGVRLLNPRESAICKQRKDAEIIRFAVYGDGKLLAEAKVDWQQPEAEITAKVTGVKKLKLVTTPAGGPAWLHMGSAWIKPALKRR